jgi:DNA-binding transcriptional LysR family regulator
MPLPLSRLQSLDLVKGFVAVGRRMSITLAAEELCLTQSAVSRQVSTLESLLGVKLLKRGHRSLAFTAEGERFFHAADLAITQLQEAWQALDRRHERLPVTVTASIGVTGLWLLPRLGALHGAHPDVEVRLAASDKVLDLAGENIDLAIRYCAPGTVPPGALPLFGERLVPVAHPSLGLAGRRLKDVVAEHVLLDFDSPHGPWLSWRPRLDALGLHKLKPRVLRFNQYDQLIHAATSGRGIALGRLPLIEPQLQARSLQPLAWDEALGASERAYWLVMAEPRPRRDVERVAAWICEQARAVATQQEQLAHAAASPVPMPSR